MYGTHDDDAAKTTLQVVPVIPIIDTKNLVVNAVKMFHPLQNSHRGILDDRNGIWVGVCNKRSDSFVCGGPEVAIIGRTALFLSGTYTSSRSIFGLTTL